MVINRERVENLRRLMRDYGLSHYLIFTADHHGSEYVSEHFKFREFVSGFTGSAGTLLVSKNCATLWTDGRYYIQAEQQLEDSGITLMRDGQPGVPSIEGLVSDLAKAGDVLGYDGRTISFSSGEKLRKALSQKGIRFKAEEDLAEEFWEDRPPLPCAPVWLLDDAQAGRSRSDKLASLRKSIKAPILITALDEIAWLYNLRGNDILYTPVALAYTIVTQEDATLYISPDALTSETASALEADGVKIKEYQQIYEDVKGQHLQMDPSSVNETLALSAEDPVFVTSPVLLAKAVKNPTEIEGERAAHIKDGVAMTKVIYRLKKLAASGDYEGMTELDVAEEILQARKDQEDFLSLSFGSISAMGEHGAIIHYEPTEESDKKLEDGLLLLDTGGHYMQGTTDVTRTVVLGEISEYERECYTAVLKGNIALGSAKFPAGTSGNKLDTLARTPLWDMGLDFEHGTGHGVGYILSVHEGPNAIRKKGCGTPLEPGMITSNEPGVYLEGRFGVRLENLILCVKRDDGFLGFETLTMVPFDVDAILPGMLTDREMALLNAYHRKVRETLTPYLDEDEAAWLAEVTAEL